MGTPVTAFILHNHYGEVSTTLLLNGRTDVAPEFALSCLVVRFVPIIQPELSSVTLKMEAEKFFEKSEQNLPQIMKPDSSL